MAPIRPISPGEQPWSLLVCGVACSVHKQLEHDLPWEEVNTTLTHSPSATAPPAAVEGVILHYADLCDTDVYRFERDEPLILRR